MKTAVVIGAGGKIGSAIAQRLTRLGYNVRSVPHDRLDLADCDAAGRCFAHIAQLDVLVNAAGSYGKVGRVRDVTPRAWMRAIDINLTGVYACCHHALPKLVPGGHIINIAGGGKGPMEMRSGYAAAKSGLWRLTETLAAEEPGLCINAIAPGPMDSRMQDAVVGIAAPWARFARELRAGRGEVPIENTLRVLDHILSQRPTGQLFFARDFAAANVAAA